MSGALAGIVCGLLAFIAIQLVLIDFALAAIRAALEPGESPGSNDG